MGRRLEDVLRSLPEGRRQRVLSRGRELVAEVLALRQLRQRLAVSQQEMAERLEVSQPVISQLEQQRDMQWVRLGRGLLGSCRQCFEGTSQVAYNGCSRRMA